VPAQGQRNPMVQSSCVRRLITRGGSTPLWPKYGNPQPEGRSVRRHSSDGGGSFFGRQNP
jgi:hypothetical protein